MIPQHQIVMYQAQYSKSKDNVHKISNYLKRPSPFISEKEHEDGNIKEAPIIHYPLRKVNIFMLE